MSAHPKLTEAARILDTLEAREHPTPGRALDLVTQVVHEQGLPYTSEAIVAASQPEQPHSPPSTPSSLSAAIPHGSFPMGKLAWMAGGLSLLVGALVGVISQVFYAAFMASICTWVGSCALLSTARDRVENGPY